MAQNETGAYASTCAWLWARFEGRQAQDEKWSIKENQPPPANNNGGDDEVFGNDENEDAGMEVSERENESEEETRALTPELKMKGIFRFSTDKTHYNIWKSATSKLKQELFDCTSDQFFPFMKSLEERGNQYGWTEKAKAILWVRPWRMSQPINILWNYGPVTLDRIQQHKLTYWDIGTCAARDDRMPYECIMSSLSFASKSKVNIHSDKCHIGNPRLPLGLCLLKVVARESYLDSNATTGMIRFSCLHSIMILLDLTIM